MKVLVTGHKGFIGSKLVDMLMKNGHIVSGCDAQFYDNFAENLFYPRDIRDITKEDIKDNEYIIHLAGLSGDNTADIIPKNAYDINYRATVRLAKLAKKNKVKRFVSISTCSLYGWQPNQIITELSHVDPNAHYAMSKYMAERKLLKLADSNFNITILRPATAYGISNNLRCDLIGNNLIAQACTQDKIVITSDGTPWRPIIHIEDFSRGCIACLEAPSELINGQIFNLGRTIDNYTVKEIAEKTSKITKKKFICTNTHPETKRNYKVSFEKIENVLKDYYKPKWNLDSGLKDTYKWMKKNILPYEYISTIYNRKYVLTELLKNNFIDTKFYWK